MVIVWSGEFLLGCVAFVIIYVTIARKFKKGK